MNIISVKIKVFLYLVQCMLLIIFEHKASFSSKLINGPNKIELYIKLGWKDLLVTNTLAYWTQSQATNKKK
jgi:hypothetical protein